MATTRTQHVVFGFVTGEVSPRFEGRCDVEKMATACRTLQNFKIGAFGQAKRRQGLRFIAYTKQSEP
jgi:hypothetical protein